MESVVFYRSIRREHGARGRLITALVRMQDYHAEMTQMPYRPLFLFVHELRFGESHLCDMGTYERLVRGHRVCDVDFDFPVISDSQKLRDSVATPAEFMTVFGLLTPSEACVVGHELTDEYITRSGSPFIR